uniref:Uncharacterized protein n=1 Tax=Siphoviridae sp. ctGN02 TaxID=2825411 RepID=A0A8S5PK05_9CAUD|nr:MAG TPA: hypothetical protein [Siphoviridae sp. ctGN02]
MLFHLVHPFCCFPCLKIAFLNLTRLLYLVLRYKSMIFYHFLRFFYLFFYLIVIY